MVTLSIPFNAYAERIRALTFQSAFVLGGLVVLGGTVWIHPSLVPFTFFEFWHMKGPMSEALVCAVPLIAFMIGMNAWHLFPRHNGYKQKPREILETGLVVSLWAGIVEEISFRWLMFFGAIVALPLLDQVCYLVFGEHLIHRLYAEIICPVANFFTLGYLRPLLLDGYGWAVGAAVITANGQFRNGHLYQGLGGFTIAWFFGMYMFWIMFMYGLPACILIHFLTDLSVFTLIAFDDWLEEVR